MRKNKVLDLYQVASEKVKLNDDIHNLAREIRSSDVKSFDSLHAACVEQRQVDILLTTDKDFINAAKRSNLTIRVENPLSWFMGCLKMDNVQLHDVKTIYKIGIDALTEKMGPVGMAQFMRFIDSGKGDYTKERSGWLDHMENELKNSGSSLNGAVDKLLSNGVKIWYNIYER